MFRRIVGLICLVLCVASCARRGSIFGGDKDTLAPKILRVNPPEKSLHFQAKEIHFYLDEYITLKDFDKQFVASPPLRNKPDISPQSLASKEIILKLRDTLAPNTTYSFNFGKSIQDNSEGNQLKSYTYICSTGDKIDSLKLKVKVQDAYQQKTDPYITIALFAENDKWNDSLIYKEKPLYIGNTLDSASDVTLQNLKAGKYRLIALKDQNSDLKFTSKTDLIGFHGKTIQLPSDSLYSLRLFKEKQLMKPKAPTPEAAQKYLLGYEGDWPSSAKINIKNKEQTIGASWSKVPKKDSIYVWVPKVETDSLSLELTYENNLQKYRVPVKKMARDSLQIKSPSVSNLPLKSPIVIESNVPLIKNDPKLFVLTNREGVVLPFKTEEKPENLSLELFFESEESEKYQLKMFPGAVQDWYNRTNDTLKFTFETRALSSYGNLKINFKSVESKRLLVELTNEKGETLYTAPLKKSQVEFTNIEPAIYTVRIIEDINDNGQWDTGSFLDNRQPEPVYYFPSILDVRANWDVEQTIDFLQLH
jgi:uncharacterized protein (DUF2141 family)